MAELSAFFFLPAELWVFDILPLLDVKSICAFARTCKLYYIYSTEPWLWKSLYKNKFTKAQKDMRRDHYEDFKDFEIEDEERALSWLGNKALAGGFQSCDRTFWKQRYGLRAQYVTEKVIVRVRYDNGTSFKTLLCTKSDLIGDICSRMSTYSTLYRTETDFYKRLLHNGTLHYTEELDYLINNFHSFQIYQPTTKTNHSLDAPRWLSPMDVIGSVCTEPASKDYRGSHNYYNSLNLLELEFNSRIRRVTYLCVLDDVVIKRSILIDTDWPVRLILHVILTHMYPRINLEDDSKYHLEWYWITNDNDSDEATKRYVDSSNFGTPGAVLRDLSIHEDSFDFRCLDFAAVLDHGKTLTEQGIDVVHLPHFGVIVLAE
eukprot:TRINITY_DN649_c0_g2_i1.p1 TRINITY_DN649_c0_g2~~TRINITY_DN649_c0_g2_i1.p1  ORF type:complete len:375 (+),score=31.02 TRINITY_DN649_c0_g2_i1:66-1190(+)